MSLGYQALYTFPRWRRLVGAHLDATGTTGTQALGLLLAFGAFYNVHNIAQVGRQTPIADGLDLKLPPS